MYLVACYGWNGIRVGSKALMFIVNICLYVQLLYLLLEYGVSNTNAIDLLKIQTLGIVVIKRDIYQPIEARRKNSSRSASAWKMDVFVSGIPSWCVLP